MARHEFLDAASQTICELVSDETAAGEHGVAHPDCTDLATVAPAHDAWQCAGCGRAGRVNGAWAMRLWFTHMPLEWAGA